MFVTAWMGLLNVKTGLLAFANAGHNPPLLKSEGGFRYRKQEMQLQKADTLYLYTDGVTEASDQSKKLYGDQRLQALLNGIPGLSAREICEAVKVDVDAFAGEAEQFDDITMLCLAWHGPQKEERS